ncbi:MAG: histidine--tRNA ligase [Candidatus Pacearchaeota archaeon]|nr:histidine--tRNA ligase [Candidatus Pacearchaeota archaeon]
MKIEVDTVKGFQDYLPPQSLKRDAIKKTIENQFKLHGFVPIETPIIEFDEIMKPSLPNEEDEAISDRFRLQDRAGRKLGLRYEFTFQLARIFKQNPTIKLPFRRYQIGEVFRDEPVSSDRFRQFTQCDADIIGDSSINADAECLLLAKNIFDKLKINTIIEINNRKLLNSILESVQITDKKNVMRELDKTTKIGEDAVKINLRKYATPNQIITLFKMLSKDLSFFKQNAFDGSTEIEELIDKCKELGFDVVFNPFMVRGFSYYTGNIFEIKVGKTTIAAGGRYDKTVGKFIGKEIPAVGISFGLERITSLADIPIETTKAIIISINEDKAMIKLAKILRKEGISCITTSDKVSKALEYANSMLIQNAIFIGEEEVEKKKYKLKNMKSGKEQFLTEKALINALKK